LGLSGYVNVRIVCKWVTPYIDRVKAKDVDALALGIGIEGSSTNCCLGERCFKPHFIEMVW
jgi:hypothetical protein